jgi:hypothetical protein
MLKEDKLLTPVETAAILGVAVQSLAAWRCTKRYPLCYLRIGLLIRYMDFLDSRYVKMDEV